MVATPWSCTILENAELCEVVEEVEGEGEAGGLRVEHGRLRMT